MADIFNTTMPTPWQLYGNYTSRQIWKASNAAKRENRKNDVSIKVKRKTNDTTSHNIQAPMIGFMILFNENIRVLRRHQTAPNGTKG